MNQTTASRSIEIVNYILDINQKCTGDEYLKELIKNIAIYLDFKYVLIGHPTNETLDDIQTDVVIADGEFIDNFTYVLKDTPCEIVLTGERVCIHDRNVSLDFPDDLLLQEMKIESYVGAPVVSKVVSGVSSILVALDTKPMEEPEFFKAVIGFLALRASAEITQQNIEDNLLQLVDKKTYELKQSNLELEKLNKNIEKESKKKLKKLEKDFINFFELNINLHLIVNSNGTILQLNSACANILGYTIEELVNTSFLELVHPDDVENTINEMKKLQNSEKIYYFENRYRHKKGHYIILAWSADMDVKGDKIYASAQNITHLKQVENEKDEQFHILERQSKMASMGEMIENIAHQWRQPLSIIRTASSGIKFKSELNMLEKDEVEETMDTISESAQHLSQTVDDFRSFFQISNKKEVFSLDKVVEKTINLTKSQFKNASIKIINNAQSISIIGQERALIQVFINILNNARDELVQLNSDTKLIIIESRTLEGYIEITFTDNAGGVPENIISKVFDANFTTKGDDDGTGIGLYMSKTIIQNQMNGKIEVKNVDFEFEKAEYNGACFIIKIPLSK